QLDRAVRSIESYTFDPQSVNGLARQRNELGRATALLQKTWNAETGWRRSLEEVRAARDQLEIRVQERTQELREALERQTAVGDVLKLISRSALDVARVSATLLESAVRLCDAQAGVILQRGPSGLDLIAIQPPNPEFERAVRELSPRLGDRSIAGQVAQDGELRNLTTIPPDVEGADELTTLYEQNLAAR